MSTEKASQSSGNLQATLSISPAEAHTGVNRAITLPGGRRVMISVPPGAYEGQIITLPGWGDRLDPDSPAGTLTLVITITPPPEMPPDAPPTGHTITLALQQSSQVLTGKMLFLVGLLLLLIAGSSGLLYLVSSLFGSLDTPSTTTATADMHKVTATVVASNPDLYPPRTGILALYDPLKNNSQGHKWDDVGGSNGSCHFTNGAYTIKTSSTNYSFYCTAQTSNFSNFAYEVQMKIVQGDAGGLAFRVTNANNTQLYYFRVNQDGTYALVVFQPHSGYLASSGSSAAIHTGLNQTNTIAVVTEGNTIGLYINHTPVKTITNRAYTHGQIGLVANDITRPTVVMFSNARVWKL